MTERAARRRGRGEGVACECCQWLRWSCGRELDAAGLMLPAIGTGVKAGVAQSVLSTRRRVPEHAGDELLGIEAQGFAAVVTVVDVAEADRAEVEIERSIVRQRTARDVAGQVQRHAAAMGVGFTDLDVPVQPVVACDGATPMKLILLGRQVQQPGIQSAPQVGEELAAEQVLERLDGDEEVGARGAPLALAVDAAGAGQAVHVRVVVERSAPGVQRHQQARHGAEVARHGTQFEHALAGAVEEKLVHPRAVELPQCDERMRQREDQVEVRAGQQLFEPRASPLALPRVGAARATAVAAGVVLDDAAVSVRTRQDARSERRGVAVADGVGRTRLARVQRALQHVVGKVLPKDVLHRAANDRTPRNEPPLGLCSMYRGCRGRAPGVQHLFNQHTAAIAARPNV